MVVSDRNDRGGGGAHSSNERVVSSRAVDGAPGATIRL